MQKNELRRWSHIVDAISNAAIFKKYNVPNSIVDIITVLSFDWKWDKSMSFGMDLCEDDKFVSHHQSDRKVDAPNGWQTTRGTLCLDADIDYIYRWDILAVDYQISYGDIVIGILQDDGFRITKENEKNFPNESYVDKCTSWSFLSSYEDQQHGNIKQKDSSRDFGFSWGKRIAYGKGFTKGDTVTTVYNTALKTLSFEVNGIDQGVAFENIDGDIYPFVAFYDQNAKAKLLSVSCTKGFKK